jgi:membrane protein DedA with SNARE-associated domain
MESPADFLARWHYGGLFLVILAEEGGIPLPIPGDLFIAAMGFLAHRDRAALAPTVAVVTTAVVIGANVLSLVSRHGGRRLLLGVMRRLGFTEAREQWLEARLTRHGAGAVVAGRLIPGLRIVTTVLSGVLRLRQRDFAAGAFAAAIVWSTIYFWLGWGLGAGYERLAGQALLGAAWPWAAGAAAILAVAFLVRRRARLQAAPRG